MRLEEGQRAVRGRILPEQRTGESSKVPGASQRIVLCGRSHILVLSCYGAEQRTLFRCGP